MSDETPLTKEEQKERLREGMQDTELLRADESYRKRLLQRRLYFVYHGICIIAMVFTLMAAFMFYINNYPFNTFSADWEISMGNLQNAELIGFDSGVIVLENGTVSYVSNQVIMWTNSMDMSNPQIAVRDDFFAVYDRGGYQVFICNSDGVTGKLTLSRKLLGLDISSAGVVAAVTENGDAGYISYHDKYGSALSVEVRTVLNNSGYPVHIALSPDGQKLAIVYYRISGGFGESRLVIYDFENGSEMKSYIAASYEDYSATDSFLIDCHFFDNQHLGVVGENCISMVTYDPGEELTRKNVVFDESIASVFWCDEGIGLVQTTSQGNYCRVYDMDGTLAHDSRVKTEYTDIEVNGNLMAFIQGNKILVENLSGAQRYEGAPVDNLVSAALIGKREIIINTGSELKKITLK